jgi:phosphomannomutase
MDETLFERAKGWMAGDPDADDRAEMAALIEAGDVAQLRARLGGRLSFGTAGLRGPIGAGSARMGTAVVRQTTAGLAAWLERTVEGAKERGVVVGYDGRHRSAAFAADVAGVLLARGYLVHAWDRCTPTPTNPWLLRARGAAAGVQVTASHNPPQDNGYKVYWEHGAQIIPPDDEGIAACIEEAAERPAKEIPVTPLAEAPAGRLRAAGAAELDAYADAVLATTPRAAGPAHPMRIVYTALHGVGQELLLKVLAAGGFPDVLPVETQGTPDGDFPTVAFPNPEEPGALDLAYAKAAEVGADLILANDPDADRLSVAIPAPAGWRQLRGDEVGVLLGDHCLGLSTHDNPLAIVSIVSSEMLGRIAAHHGARFAQCLTGFKWILAEARRLAADGHRFVYGYEEALGYCVSDLVPDKDGISAALAVCGLASGLAARGRTLADRLQELYAIHGTFVTGQVVRRFSGARPTEEMAQAMAAVRQAPPATIDGEPLWRIDDHLLGVRRDGAETRDLDGPSADLICLRYGAPGAGPGLRILVRPSGTEPKVKAYFEWQARTGEDVARERLTALMAAWEAEGI